MAVANDERKIRILAMLPVMATAVLVVGVSGAYVAAIAAAILAVVAAWRGPQVALTPVLGGAISAGIAVLAAIFVPLEWIRSEGAGLSELSVRAAVGLMLGVSMRLHLRTPAGGRELSSALLLGAAVACGQSRGTWDYPVMVALVLIAMAAAWLGEQDGGPGWRRLDARRKRTIVLGSGVGVLLAAGLIVAIPVSHARVVRFFYEWDRGGSTTGISGEIMLGSAADITESDELVLRVHGPRPDYLRGVVFNRYRNGRWVPGEADPGKPTVMPASLGDGATRIEATKPGPRYFVPLDVRSVAVPPGLAVIDGMGTYRAPSGTSADELEILIGVPAERAVAPPSTDDVELPAQLRGTLASLASEWTGEAATDQARLEAIERRLHAGYRYALKHERRTNADPIVDFLTQNRVGHCEYFASAMALLARSEGIPARVVSGFRVHEHNPVGGFHVVRARDAHAWVEAWDGERWRTFDPTPPSAWVGGRPSATPWIVAVWDWAWDRWSRLDGTHVRLSLFGGTFVLAAGSALVLWMRRARSRVAVRSDVDGIVVPGMAELFASLAEAGWVRHPAESLESFSTRLRDDGRPELASAAAIVDRYAALLYGGIGTVEELARVSEDWARSTARNVRAT